MQQFFRIFLDIVLWRRGPQDLPVSQLLLALAVAGYVLVSVVQLVLLRESAATWLFFVVADPLLLYGWTWLVLRIFGKTERLQQTATAVFGASATLGVVMYLPLQALLMAAGQDVASAPSQVVALLLVVAFALVTGRILKIATDTNLFTGIAMSLTYFVVVNLLVGVLHGTGT